MTKLKRCPFCGSTPRSGVEFYESCGAEVSLCAVIECPKCNAGKRVIFTATNPISMIPFGDYEKAFADVVDKWNTRVKDGEADAFD